MGVIFLDPFQLICCNIHVTVIYYCSSNINIVRFMLLSVTKSSLLVFILDRISHGSGDLVKYPQHVV